MAAPAILLDFDISGEKASLQTDRKNTGGARMVELHTE